MNIVIRASGGRNIVLRPQARAAFYASTALMPATVEVYWHWQDEPPSAARLIGRYLPGQTVQWPYNPTTDRNIVLRTISISAAGVRSPRDLRDAPFTIVVFQRELEAPIVSQVGAATHALITLAIDGVSQFAIKRRIRIADDSGMTTATTTQIAPASFIDAAFIGTLAREPSQAELIIWRNALKTAYDTGTSAVHAEGATRVRSLFESSPGVATAEYAARSRSDGQFIQDCYAAYLARLPDQAGYDFWVGVLAGSSRAAVLNGFDASGEFLGRTEAKPYADVTPGQTLPRLVDLSRNDTAAGTRKIWVRVSHSSGGGLWGAESPAQSFTYADNGGAGGDTGDTDPFLRHDFGTAIV